MIEKIIRVFIYLTAGFTIGWLFYTILRIADYLKSIAADIKMIAIERKNPWKM
jgi:hypothetical protein